LEGRRVLGGNIGNEKGRRGIEDWEDGMRRGEE
jgi:hypothetical protein